MSETPPEFDLKFLPAWLKESEAAPKYANYEGEPERRDRGGREGGFGGRGRPGGGGGDRRGPRPGGGGGERRGPGGPGERRGPGGGGKGPRGDRGPRGPQSGEGERRRSEEPRPPAAPPVQVKIEFLPEESGAAAMAARIKASNRSYPLFEAGRLFLERPERHRVRISSIDPTVVLYQMGDGPIALDPSALEKTAFQTLKDQYYQEEVVQGEPLKGNFANVARSRATGIFLGPTNYHSYQPNLRRLYEERFARRMSFQDFLYQDVEIRTDEQAINDWKEQARTATTFTTTQEPEPVTFKTAAEAEAHFRAHYLRGLVKGGLSLECSGPASRALPDAQLRRELREGWERERAFPAGMVNNLRPYFQKTGLHFFKHRKRVLYVTAIRPLRQPSAGQPLSAGVAAILQTVQQSPRCTRRVLAAKILGANAENPEATEPKESLARDLHYLIHSGLVIEFHDGALDLPLAPNPPPVSGKRAASAPAGSGEAASLTPAPATDLPEVPETVEEFSAEAGDETLAEIHAETPEPEADPALAAAVFSAEDAVPEVEMPAAPPSGEFPHELPEVPVGELHAASHVPEPAPATGELQGSDGEPLSGADSLQASEPATPPLAPILTHEPPEA